MLLNYDDVYDVYDVYNDDLMKMMRTSYTCGWQAPRYRSRATLTVVKTEPSWATFVLVGWDDFGGLYWEHEK